MKITKLLRKPYRIGRQTYPDSLKKDYVPFEESNLKRFNNSMSVEVPPEIK